MDLKATIILLGTLRRIYMYVDKNGFVIQLLFFIFSDVSDLNSSINPSCLKKVNPLYSDSFLTKDVESRCILSPATIFEETAIPRKSEKAGISCAGRFIQDSSFLVINTLAKPSVSRDEIDGESQERRRDVRL